MAVDWRKKLTLKVGEDRLVVDPDFGMPKTRVVAALLARSGGPAACLADGRAGSACVKLNLPFGGMSNNMNTEGSGGTSENPTCVTVADLLATMVEAGMEPVMVCARGRVPVGIGQAPEAPSDEEEPADGSAPLPARPSSSFRDRRSFGHIQED